MRAAMTEAQNAFGDNRVFVEKFVTQPRHIEIQILADQHGNIIYLGERECSIQRRHQKVIEEAPSPFISAETRAAMGKQAVELARAVDYRSAGTVEFIVGADQDFYFLEMNTRLQVEHPVTELVYGLDLVEWMIRIAAGEKLGISQADIVPDGWAVEARLYAEDPERGFLPSIGQLTRYREPAGAGVRVDSGVDEGGAISMFYDPMISKLIAHAPTRDEAISRLHLALDHYEIDGIASNRQFLSAVLENKKFCTGEITTGFIDAEFEGGFSVPMPHGDRKAGLCALATAIIARQLAERHAGEADQDFVALDQDDNQINTSWHGDGSDGVTVSVDGVDYRIVGSTRTPAHLFDGTINEIPLAVQIRQNGHHMELTNGATRLKVALLPRRFAAMLAHMPAESQGGGADEVLAPMPGLLTSLLVDAGDTVQAGQDVAIIEAMKMENVLKAEARGTVAEVHVKQGDNLNVDDLILSLAIETD